MDRTISRDSNSPTTTRNPEKPPFKLCFSKDRLPGKSSIRGTKINGDTITPKFYSREYENATDMIEEISDQKSTTTKDVCQWPLLTSRTYGWWHEYGIQPKESRFNFHKRTSDLVNFQMKIYAEDRRLEGLK